MSDNEKNVQHMEKDDAEEDWIHLTTEEVKTAVSSSVEDSQLLSNFSFGNSAKAPIVESNTASSEESSFFSKIPFIGFLHSVISAFSNIELGLPKTASSQAAALPTVEEQFKVGLEIDPKAESPRPSGAKILKCKQCQHQSLSKDEQWEHAKSHIPIERQKKCPECNFVTEYKHHLEYHYRNQHEKPTFFCPACAYSCFSKFQLNCHMNTHGDHQCSMCDYRSMTEERLKKHIRESHTVEEQLKVGLEIEPRADSPSSSEAPVFNCYQCGHQSLSKDEKWEHARSHIPIEKQKNCTECNFVCKYQHHLNDHYRNQHEKPTFFCPVCAFSCYWQSQLNRHMDTHGDHQCSMCDYRSMTEERLKKHIRESHTVEEQLKVGLEIEPRADSPSSSEEQVWKCYQCGHQSLSEDEKWEHARSHIPIEKQKNCTECNFVCKYQHHLDFHYWSHHKTTTGKRE